MKRLAIVLLAGAFALPMLVQAQEKGTDQKTAKKNPAKKKAAKRKVEPPKAR